MSKKPNLYTMTGKQDEKGWREKVRRQHPKSEIRSTGGGTLVASEGRKMTGHYRDSLGGFVLRKGVKL